MLGFVGICAYGIVLAVATLVALFTKGWTRNIIIGLALAWIPFLVFGVLAITAVGTAQGGSVFGFLITGLVVASPIILMIVIILVIMKLFTIWRG